MHILMCVSAVSEHMSNRHCLNYLIHCPCLKYIAEHMYL